MRWLYADPNNAAEMSYRQETQAAIDGWWRAFQKRAPDIVRVFSRQSEMDLPGWMIEALGAVHPEIMWEYGPALRGAGHRLVITPEMNHHLRPLVRSLLERAPRMPGWEFYAHRLPENPEQVLAAVEARLGLKIHGARISAAGTRSGKIDVSYLFPPELRLDENQAANAAFVASETLFGEQTLDAWIGGIEMIDPLNRDPNRRLLPLERGQETVSALINSFLEQLPDRPYWDRAYQSDDEIWSSFQIPEPEFSEDYPEREDLMFGSTRWMPLVQTVHGGKIFYSSCHSRHGETFCYLKLDAMGILNEGEDLVFFRTQIEEALVPRLMQAQIGGLVGGGSGLRYSYIDLALTDVSRAIALIRSVLAECEAPTRSWLLFFDCELSAEWVGIFPDTPAPPRREREDE